MKFRTPVLATALLTTATGIAFAQSNAATLPNPHADTTAANPEGKTSAGVNGNTQGAKTDGTATTTGSGMNSQGAQGIEKGASAATQSGATNR
jgi:hypothetical protein